MEKVIVRFDAKDFHKLEHIPKFIHTWNYAREENIEDGEFGSITSPEIKFVFIVNKAE